MSPAQGRLLVFTLGPGADARRHPLLPESYRGEELRLRQACFDGVVGAGIEEGLEVVISAPRCFGTPGASWRAQGTGTFGERFARAISTSFEEKAGVLVVVGTDSPGLSASHLAEARRKVEEDEEAVVLGPAPDGGFYLLAAARPLGAVLDGVPWCGPRTRSALVAALRRAGRPVHLLPPLCDLDRASDAARLLRYPGSLCPALLAAAEALGRALRGLRQCLSSAQTTPPTILAAAGVLGRAPPSL